MQLPHRRALTRQSFQPPRQGQPAVRCSDLRQSKVHHSKISGLAWPTGHAGTPGR